MAYPVYYVEENDVLPVLFDTFDGGTGASITLTGLAVTDIEVYKDGLVTQRASDSGYTLLDTDGIDFDTITGIHGFSIDLSDNTDAGFYTVGPWYHVVVSSVTIDAQTVNFVACAFRIVSAARGMAGTALPAAAADAAGGLPISDAGGLDLDAILDNLDAAVSTRAAPADVPSAAANADAVWDEAKAGHVGVGSFGEEVQAHALTSEVAAVETDTQDIQARLPATLVGGRMDSDVGAKSGDVALSAQEKTDVNAEVSDVLKTDPVTLPGQTAPPAAPTIEGILSWLYKTFRNKKEQTSAEWRLYNDAGTVVDSKAAVGDDGTTATKEEVAAGP